MRKDIKMFESGKGGSAVDKETADEANLAELVVRQEVKARMQRVRVSLRCSLTKSSGSSFAAAEAAPAAAP